MMTWFRLYHDTPDDIKLRRFTPQEKWAWIALLCLASKSGDRGSILAQDEDIADYCEFNSTQDWLYYRDKLIAKGMLEISGVGTLSILHWNERQYDKPSSTPEATKERKRRQREREKELKAVNVTPMSRDVTPFHATDTERDPDPEKKLSELEIADFALAHQPNTPGIDSEENQDAVEELTVSTSVNQKADTSKKEVAGDKLSAAAKNHQRFIEAYNAAKPAWFGSIKLINDARRRKIRELVKSCGGVDEAIAVVCAALKEAESDPFWKDKKLSFENFVSNGKAIGLYERSLERLNTQPQSTYTPIQPAGYDIVIDPAEARAAKAKARALIQGAMPHAI